ncbi:succinylglutamate desuccinylase [Paraglaciecola aquimarina]|uniref:Succinylglutamate desuccinylase n=1 Tax=Paraglaciecola algarum TaxID=3050085 RepID=A0ABS9D4J2_9ALTE|nr:succinylglutamate desuccinylase [Paraglaciecola sp. G1-23]
MDLIEILLGKGEFLALSRNSAYLFSQPFRFDIGQHTVVKVVAAGVISFEPKQASNKDIILSCGIHGNETAPIEICDALVQDILLQKILVTQRVLVIFGNLRSMDVAQRFVEENMNRLFSLGHDNKCNNYERSRARLLEQAVENFYLSAEPDRERLHYDLHTAIRTSKNDKFAVYPFLHGKPWSKAQLQILLACGVNTILLSGNPTTTFSYFSSIKFAAHAFTIELGKVKPFGENDMGQFQQVVSTLRLLVSSHNLKCKEFAEEDFFIFKVNQVINKGQSDFTLNFPDDLANFSDFPKGHLLAFESGCEYRAQYDGEAIVFPNAQVEIGQRALLTVIPTKI